MTNTIESIKEDSLFKETFHSMMLDTKKVSTQESEAIQQSNNVLSQRTRQKLAADKAQTPGASSPRTSTGSNSSSILLQSPEQYLSSLKGGDADQSLIALIGLALTLQAQQNSQFWSTLWKQASVSMEQAVNFAPAIFDSITAKYQGQADQTTAQADNAKWQGVLEGFTAVAIIGMGVMEGVNLKNEPAEPKANLEDETAAEGAGNLASEADSDAESVMSDLEQEENQATTTEQLGRKLDDLKTGGLKKAQSLLKILGNVSKKVQVVQGLTGFAGKFVESNYKQVEVEATKRTGAADATAQEMEQFGNYYNQNFNRTEGLRDGSQNNFDNVLKLLEQISNTITQTTQSMFRG